MFLKESKLQTALTVIPLVYYSHVEKFCGNAQVVKENETVSIHSTVQRSSIVVTKDVIRRVLILDDALGLNVMEMDEVHGIFRRLGYQESLQKLWSKMQMYHTIGDSSFMCSFIAYLQEKEDLMG